MDCIQKFVLSLNIVCIMLLTKKQLLWSYASCYYYINNSRLNRYYYKPALRAAYRLDREDVWKYMSMNLCMIFLVMFLSVYSVWTDTAQLASLISPPPPAPVTPMLTAIMTHCIGCPHRCRPRSRRCRHTPKSWRYSGDSHIQTVLVSKTYLCREKITACETKSRDSTLTSDNMALVGALQLTAMGLVCSVLTVILFVAGPAHGNAAATGTGEEVHGTLQLPLLCNRRIDFSKEYMRVMGRAWECCIGVFRVSDLGSSSHRKSLRSRSSHHTARRVRSTVWCIHISEKSHLSLLAGRSYGNLLGLRESVKYSGINYFLTCSSPKAI